MKHYVCQLYGGTILFYFLVSTAKVNLIQGTHGKKNQRGQKKRSLIVFLFPLDSALNWINFLKCN